jgi:hypothetical protein
MHWFAVLTSRRSSGQQDRDAIDDGIATAAAGAANGVRLQRERLTADRACKPVEVRRLESGLGLIGHGYKVQGSRFEVRGKANTEILTLRVRMTAMVTSEDECGGKRYHGC